MLCVFVGWCMHRWHSCAAVSTCSLAFARTGRCGVCGCVCVRVCVCLGGGGGHPTASILPHPALAKLHVAPALHASRGQPAAARPPGPVTVSFMAWPLSLRPTARPLHGHAAVSAGWCRMQRYGFDWEKIQRHVLPTKTASQISIRFKNRCSSRSPPNAIKVTPWQSYPVNNDSSPPFPSPSIPPPAHLRALARTPSLRCVPPGTLCWRFASRSARRGCASRRAERLSRQAFREKDRPRRMTANEVAQLLKAVEKCRVEMGPERGVWRAAWRAAPSCAVPCAAQLTLSLLGCGGRPAQNAPRAAGRVTSLGGWTAISSKEFGGRHSAERCKRRAPSAPLPARSTRPVHAHRPAHPPARSPRRCWWALHCATTRWTGARQRTIRR
jgi:hypothetical protein